MDSALSTIWGDNSAVPKDMKSIWSVREDDLKTSQVKGEASKKKKPTVVTTFLAPKIFQEAAKGGRLYMDEVYNQLEELEMERRCNEGELGLNLSEVMELKRGSFEWNGIAAMLAEAQVQFSYLKQFIKTVEGVRADSETVATSLSPDERVALINELFLGKKAEADEMRQKFNKTLIEVYDTWDFKMAAIQRVLFPQEKPPKVKENVKLDVMPYLLKELAEVVRVSRITLYTVRKRYDEVRSRMDAKASFDQPFAFLV